MCSFTNKVGVARYIHKLLHHNPIRIYHFKAFSDEFASTLTIGFDMNLHPQPMKPKKPSLQNSCELAITTTQNSLQIHMKGRIVVHIVTQNQSYTKYT